MTNKSPSPQNELDISIPKFDISVLLEKVLLGGIIFVLAVPLLGDYGTWLFPIGRDVIFKLTIEFLILVYIAFLFSKKQCTGTLWTPIAISLAVFLFIMTLATIFSVQQEFSIWGNIYKNQGLMTWTHYVLFFFLLIGFLQDKEHWKFLIHTAIFVATLVGLIALWQIFQNGSGYRAASTLNNSNYLAAYLVLLLPITFAFFLRNKSFFLGSAAAIQFLALLFTQTRGGYLGIASAIFVFAFLYFLYTKGISKEKLFICALIPTVIILTTYSLLLTTSAGQSAQEKLPNFTDRFLNRHNILSDSGPRLEAWQAGWQGMRERPLLGYGPENFFVAFDEHYSGSQDHAGSLAKEGTLWESWFDKAHNFIFDIGATTGFPGLLAYTAIFISAAWVLMRRLGTMNDESKIMSIGLISALIGYLAQNLLGFDTIVLGIYLMFLFGYANFLSNKKLKITDGKRFWIFRPRRISLGLMFSAWILLFVIFLFSLNLHADILRANHQLNLAESLARNVGVEQAFAAFEKGLEYSAVPVNPNLRRRYAVIALAYYGIVDQRCSLNPAGSDPAGLNCENLFSNSKKYLVRALELQNENAATEWPRFTRNYIYAAQISHILDDYENSDSYFEKALELSPGRNSIHTEWDRLLNKRE